MGHIIILIFIITVYTNIISHIQMGYIIILIFIITLYTNIIYIYRWVT